MTDIRSRLAEIEGTVAQRDLCPTCGSGGPLFLHQDADGVVRRGNQVWSRNGRGDLYCPACGSSDRTFTVLRSAIPPEQFSADPREYLADNQ